MTVTPPAQLVHWCCVMLWGPGPRAGGLLVGLLLTMDYLLTCLRPPPPLTAGWALSAQDGLFSARCARRKYSIRKHEASDFPCFSPWAVQVSLCSFDSRHWIRGPVNWPNMYQRDPQHWDKRSGPNGEKIQNFNVKKEKNWALWQLKWAKFGDIFLVGLLFVGPFTHCPPPPVLPGRNPDYVPARYTTHATETSPRSVTIGRTPLKRAHTPAPSDHKGAGPQRRRT